MSWHDSLLRIRQIGEKLSAGTYCEVIHDPKGLGITHCYIYSRFVKNFPLGPIVRLFMTPNVLKSLTFTHTETRKLSKTPWSTLFAFLICLTVSSVSKRWNSCLIASLSGVSVRGALSVTPPESYSGLDLNQHTPLCKCFCLSCTVLSVIIVLLTVQLYNALAV